MDLASPLFIHCLNDAPLYHDCARPLWDQSLDVLDVHQIDSSISILLLGRNLDALQHLEDQKIGIVAFVRDAIYYPQLWQEKLQFLYASSMSEVLLASSLKSQLPIKRIGLKGFTPLRSGDVHSVMLVIVEFSPLIHAPFLAAWKLIEKQGLQMPLHILVDDDSSIAELNYWIRKLGLQSTKIITDIFDADLWICLENDRQEGLMDSVLQSGTRVMTLARGRSLDLTGLPELPLFLTPGFHDQEQRFYLQVSKISECLQRAMSPRPSLSCLFELPELNVLSRVHFKASVSLEARALKAQAFETQADFHAYPWDLKHQAGEYRSQDPFHRHFIEFCSSSLNDLRPRVQSMLGPGAYLLDDERDLTLRSYVFEERADIVLFGGAMTRLIESGSWPFQSMRLFVLSRALKNFLVSWFRFDPKEIGLLSRADLYPLQPAQFQSHQGLQFVIASRLSRPKQIELVLAFVSAWQQHVDETATLTIFGSYDEHANTFDHDDDKAYEQQVKQCLQSLPWKSPPVYLGNRPDWWSFPFLNPCFCHFSHFDQEDFSVSLSEALTQGWPCFLSSFGGHHDVQGEGVIHWPLDLFSKGDSLIKKGQALALYFEQALLLHNRSEFSTPETFYPEIITQARLGELRFQVLAKLGWSFHFLLKGMRAEFALTPQGQQLLQEYRSFMRGDSLE